MHRVGKSYEISQIFVLPQAGRRGEMMEERHIHDYFNHESDPDHCIGCCSNSLSEERARTLNSEAVQGLLNYCRHDDECSDMGVNEIDCE